VKNSNIVHLLLLACGVFNTINCESSKIVKQDPKKEVIKEVIILKEPVAKKDPGAKTSKLLSVSNDKSSAEFTVSSTTDIIYNTHCTLFSSSPLDQSLTFKNNWDFTFEAVANEWLKVKAAARTRATWGNETSIMPVTGSTIKLGDAVVGDHNHFVARMVPWIREAWVDFSLNKAFNMDDRLEHKVKVGAFPFVLGRGIALGSAYSAIPGFLGFCASNAIDQFVFGQLLSGELKPGRVSYNVYSAILENFSDNFARVNTIIYESEIGHHDHPERGFGSINFILASNLKFLVLDGNDGLGTLEAEPYIVYNKAPEQKVEFSADASSKLASVGICVDYTGDQFEWGFDTAFNFGSQDVLAWDRNQIELFVDTDGIYKERYTYVRASSGSYDTSDKAIVTKDAKTIVMGSGSGQGVALNGAEIGSADGLNYFNDNNRFRAGYKNKYRGLMFVADAYWNVTPDKKFKLAGTLGWATGDENPNRNLTSPNDSEVDGDYQGFIGLQEVYSGKRVLSFFLLGPNNVARPLSSPSFTNSTTARSAGYATNINGFTNLFFIGNGIDWATKFLGKGLRVKSYVLSYWQDKATNRYDAVNQVSLPIAANAHLGTEFNVTLRLVLLDDLSGYFKGGVFVPGQHYEDIKGKPLNSTQLAALNSLDSTGYPATGVPVIGTSTALALNWGLEFVF